MLNALRSILGLPLYKTIDALSIAQAEYLWNRVYRPEGWDVAECLHVAWSSKEMTYVYRMVLKKEQ